jgi:hypothetical protein
MAGTFPGAPCNTTKVVRPMMIENSENDRDQGRRNGRGPVSPRRRCRFRHDDEINSNDHGGFLCFDGCGCCPRVPAPADHASFDTCVCLGSSRVAGPAVPRSPALARQQMTTRMLASRALVYLFPSRSFSWVGWIRGRQRPWRRSRPE